MAYLLNASNYNGDVLIVGDGNFTFSLSLVESLYNAGNLSHVVCTSYDSKEILQSDELAIKSLLDLEKFPNVEIIHCVDATNLSRTFHDRTFTRIIFNFPHCGGKSNISKSRTLLEKFFASAREFIVPSEGQIYMTLCNGQGGTPEDSPQRIYGNTWQVVRQAAKAGFVLNKVLNFFSSDYPHYKNAGFRGKLKKSFFSYKDGLTHVFICSAPLKNMQHVSEFEDEVQRKVVKFLEEKLQRKLLTKEEHPVCMARVYIENMFKKFQQELSVISSELCLIGGVSQHKNRIQEKVLESIREHKKAFVTSGLIISPGCKISPRCYPVQHEMVFIEIRRKEVNLVKDDNFFFMEIINFVKSTVFKDMNICICVREDEKSVEKNVIGESVLNTSEHNDSRGSGSMKTLYQNYKPKVDQKCSCTSHILQSKPCPSCKILSGIDTEEVCISSTRHELWDEILEKGYVSSSSLIHHMKSEHTLTELLHPLKTYSFYEEKKELYVGSCCVIPGSTLSKYDWSDEMEGVMVTINLDKFAMIHHNINDIRWLWSEDHRFLQQFVKENPQESSPVQFIPHSLYPDTFVHDICFWIQEKMSEELFFAVIHVVAQGCVREVSFMHRYYDPVSRAISYCYRMEYSRCDGALTKENSVDMQNLLRRVLMLLNFGLK